MRVGDYVQFTDDNVGMGPNGSYRIVEISEEDVVYFQCDTWIDLPDLVDYFDEGKAYITKGYYNDKYIQRHTFI